MSLFGWKKAGQSATTSPATPTPKSSLPVPPAPAAPPQPDDPALATARWDHKRFGMENFGNTCYANSVLQALYYCDPFRQLLCDAPDRTYPTGPGAYTTAPPVQPPAPATAAKSKPAHTRRSSTADQRDLTTPHHMAFAGTGSAALAAATFVAPPSVTPHKTTSTPTPAPIVNVGPVIPAFPPSLFSALRSLYIHIAANPADKGTVSPRAFVEKLKKENELFRGNMHQDAHEFLNYLLNSVVEDLTHEMKAGPLDDLSKSVLSEASAASQPASSHTSPHLTLVHDLFEGTLTSETRCLTCETVSSRDESFLDLSIDIERNSSVTACLRQFSASEMLCQKNKFFCDSCCGLQEAEKRMKIKKLPNVLALHLKRFKYQEDVQRYIKLSYRVAFPFELRLFNTVDDAQDPDRLYELFAIVVHVGSGPHHGHYITIAKQRGQWLLFDDDIVEGIRESEIPKYFGDSPAGSGYVLFYQAVNIDLQALGVKSPPSPQTSTVIQPQNIPPVVVEAPTSPGGVMEEREREKVVARTSPSVSESGTIGTPSTPTPSQPPSSPLLSKTEASSTAPSSIGGSGFKPLAKNQLNGSITGSDSVSSGPSNADTGLTPTTKNGKSRESSGSWFPRWGSKKKSKDVSSTPSRKNTLDDHHIPFLDIQQPSASTTLRSTSGSRAEHKPPVLHDEPEQSLANSGLGVEFGTSSQMTDEPVSASISASSSGDHLHHSGTLPQSVDHLHPAHGTTYKPVTHASPPRASRSGSVSATTNGSGSGSTSGLHVPSYPSPSASSSASSVSTPLRHNASAPKLSAPFPLAMSPMKAPKRPSTASSSPAVPFARSESPPPPMPPLPIPLRGQPMGLPDLPQPPLSLQPAPKTKGPRRKLSFSSALNTFGRSKDKSFSKHDRRISIAEDVEALPQLVPNSPLKRK